MMSIMALASNSVWTGESRNKFRHFPVRHVQSQLEIAGCRALASFHLHLGDFAKHSAENLVCQLHRLLSSLSRWYHAGVHLPVTRQPNSSNQACAEVTIPRLIFAKSA
jgi:hypothetical protein